MGGVAGGFQLARCWARVAASLGLPTRLAVLGDRKEKLELKARDWWFGLALVLKVLAEGELGMLDLSPSDLAVILASFHLTFA